jgi:hypothetical protein
MTVKTIRNNGNIRSSSSVAHNIHPCDIFSTVSVQRNYLRRREGDELRRYYAAILLRLLVMTNLFEKNFQSTDLNLRTRRVGMVNNDKETGNEKGRTKINIVTDSMRAELMVTR